MKFCSDVFYLKLKHAYCPFFPIKINLMREKQNKYRLKGKKENTFGL